MTQYTPDIIERAENLYVMDGLPMGEIAREIGCAIATVQRWGEKGKWVEVRREYLSMERFLRRNMYTLRKNAMEQAIKTPDPQTIYAVARLETLALRDRKEQAEETVPGVEADIPRLFLDHVQFIIEFLKSKEPEAVKLLARNFDAIIDAFKANEN